MNFLQLNEIKSKRYRNEFTVSKLYHKKWGTSLTVFHIMQEYIREYVQGGRGGGALPF